MKRFTGKKIFLTLLAIILIAVFWPLARVWHFPDTAWPLGKDDKLKVKEEAIQKFEAGRGNLSQIKILFGNSKVGTGGQLILKVYDESCSNLIRESTNEIAELNSDVARNFTFFPIKDSKEKIYCLKLTYDSKENKKSTASVSVFAVPNTLPKNIDFSIDGIDLPGQSLSFRPGYRNTSWLGNITELDQRISQYKPWFLKAGYLIFIAFGFILFSIAAIVLLI